MIINDNANVIKIIDPNVSGAIIIWNFHSGDLIKKIWTNDIAIIDI